MCVTKCSVDHAHSFENVPLVLGYVAQLLIVLQSLAPPFYFLATKCQLFKNSFGFRVVFPSTIFSNEQAFNGLFISLVVAKADAHLGVRRRQGAGELILWFSDLDRFTEIFDSVFVHLYRHVKSADVVQQIGAVEIWILGVNLDCTSVALQTLLVLFKFCIAGSQVVHSLGFLLLWLYLFGVEGVDVNCPLILLQFEITVAQI